MGPDPKALNNLGLVFANLKKWAEAEHLLAQALDILLTTLPADHTTIQTVETSLAIIHENLAKGQD